MPMPTAMPTRRHAARRARNVLMALPVLAHGLYRVLTHCGAPAPNGGDRRCGDESDAERCKLPGRNGEIDAPIEGLAIDHVNQDQAQCGAETEAIGHTECAGEDAFARGQGAAL